MNKDQKFVIVTGLSGAGLSSVLKALEDMGFEVFDNFPLSLVESLAEQDVAEKRPVALGIDSRTRGFDSELVIEMAQLYHAKLVFITCDSDVLQVRFKETRRRHPMAGGKTVSFGIKQEREVFKPVQDAADITIDTSELSVHDLRHILEGYFKAKEQSHMAISLMSFGFRYGAPREADIVMDVRFLQNPNWVKELKPKSGLDADVGAHIEKDESFQPFLANFKSLLEIVLPRYAHEGKSYLTIAMGCTGGQHRSVYIVELLKAWLRDGGYVVTADHRDITS